MIRLSLYIFLWFISMAIAIFATQNISLVNLRFFTFESIKLPLGLLLIFSAGFGAACANLLDTSTSFELPTIPKFSVFDTKNKPSKRQTTSQASNPTKDSFKTSKNSKNDFDQDWDEDWG